MRGIRKSVHVSIDAAGCEPYTGTIRIMAIRERIVALFKKRPEAVFVLQIGGAGMRGTLFEVGVESKKVRVVKTIAQPTTLEDGARLAADIAGFIKKFRNAARARVLLSFDSRLASTVHGVVLLVRANAKEGIDETDLDNLLAHGAWKMYDRERGRAAERLRIHDFQVLLADVHLKRIKVDGHRVANPLGFPARMIELQLTQTFLAKSFSDFVRKLIPVERITAVEETMPLLGGLLAQSGEAEDFLLGEVQADRTHIFLIKGNAITYMDTFAWGEQQFLKGFMELWSVDETMVNSILSVCREHRASERFLKKMDEHLAGELQIMANGFSSHIAKADSGVVYLHSWFTLPELVWSSRFGARVSQRVKLRPVSLEGVRQRIGFSLDYKKGVQSADTAIAEASVWSWLSAPHDERMARTLKRHSHWLSGAAVTTS